MAGPKKIDASSRRLGAVALMLGVLPSACGREDAAEDWPRIGLTILKIYVIVSGIVFVMAAFAGVPLVYHSCCTRDRKDEGGQIVTNKTKRYRVPEVERVVCATFCWPILTVAVFGGMLRETWAALLRCLIGRTSESELAAGDAACSTKTPATSTTLSIRELAHVVFGSSDVEGGASIEICGDDD